MRWLAATILRRRCASNQSARNALETWKALPLELSANVNPFVDVVRQPSLPSNYETEYYPGETETVAVADYMVTLDVLGMPNDNLTNAIHLIPTLAAATPDSTQITETHIWFLQAGHDFFGTGQYQLAFRCYLNACRILPPHGDIISPGMRSNLGKCLMELGDFQNAGSEYLLAAEQFKEGGDDESAAECFEQSALCWEALDSASRYELGTDGGMYDSTKCFRLAKYLYLAIGDYESASRCSILEQDCILRWPSQSSRLPRRVMRGMWLYGESPLYVFACLVVILFVSATAFLFGGYNRANAVVEYDVSFHGDLGFNYQTVADCADAFYLSVVTMSTLGYGDLSPASAVSKAVAGVTSLSGIVLAAMLLVALQRRYVGR